MILLALVVLLGLGIGWAVTESRRRGPATVATRVTVRGDLARDLHRWVTEELLSEEQASAILGHERARTAVVHAPTPSRPHGERIPVVAEALGYLGGVLATVGLVLVLSHTWPDLTTAWRLALTGTGAGLLVGLGALVHEQADPALARLRWTLWLASTAAFALFARELAFEPGPLGLEAEAGAAVVAGAVTLESGLLWWWRARPVQQATFLGGLAVLVGTSMVALASEGVAGLVLWGLGAGYLVAALARWTPQWPLTELAGVLTLVAGAAFTVGAVQSAGLLFALTTSLVLLGLVLAPRLELTRTDRLVIGVPALLALVQFLPPTLVHFSQDGAVATGLVTWTAGGALVVAAVAGQTRLPLPTEVAGGLALLGGAALTGVAWPSLAPVLGLLTSVALLAAGMLPGQVLLSLLGAIGLLVNVPWAIARFFPGEGRVPLLIMVAGGLLIGLAVLLTRMADRFHHDLGAGLHHP